MAPIEEVSKALAALPGVSGGKSRLGSGRAAWFIAGREFAHLHDGSVVDLRLPREIQRSLHGDDRVRLRKGASEWVEIELRRPEDIEWLTELARLAIKPLRG